MNHFVDPPDATPTTPDHGTGTVAMPQLQHEPATKRRRTRGLGRLVKGRGESSTMPTDAATRSTPQAQWQKPHVPRVQRRGGSDVTRLVLLVVVILVALGLIGMATGVLQLGTPESVGVGAKGSSGTGVTGDTWSYYHDRDYETDSTGPKWSTDRTRSTDPNAAALGDTSRWEYDGAYKYGPYGQDGMSRRASGRETADPLYSQADPLSDVFQEYGGTLDPAGDQAVGAPPSNFTNPYYDPYAGYTNPYANRLRLAYGEGYDTTSPMR